MFRDSSTNLLRIYHIIVRNCCVLIRTIEAYCARDYLRETIYVQETTYYYLSDRLDKYKIEIRGENISVYYIINNGNRQYNNSGNNIVLKHMVDIY